MAASIPIASQANVFPYTGCANCFVFGWVQPDPAELRKCAKCKVLRYCSQECQAEHWKMVHKDQCKWLTKDRESSKIPVTIFSLSSFPSGPLSENTLECLVELIQRVLVKMRDTNHPVCSMFPADMKGLEDQMVRNKRVIWAHQKIFPKQAKSFPSCLLVPVSNSLVEYVSQAREDLGSILFLLCRGFVDHQTVLELDLMKDPHAMIPKDLWSGAGREVGVFPSRLQELINTFYEKRAFYHVGQGSISYEELLKILCGGSLIQECSFCSNTTKIEALAGEKVGLAASALIKPYFSPTFSCSGLVCNIQMDQRMKTYTDLVLAEDALFKKLQITRCDFCFKHAEKVKR